jgi:hypothetical protein
MADTQPSLAAENALSGVVVAEVPATAQPSIPGGLRVVGLIGTGLNYKNVTVTITRGSIPDTFDLLNPVALSLPSTITDENNKVYSLGSGPGVLDYWLSLPTSTSAAGVSTIDWNAALPSVGFNTLIVNLNGDGNQTITLFTTDANPVAVAADIQLKVRALVPFNTNNAQAYLQFTAVAQASTNQYVLTSGTTPLGSVNVNGGTAAALLKLGTANDGIEVPGGSISWGPAGVAAVTGAIDIGAAAFPSGVNLNGQTFEVSANGSPVVQSITFVGTSLSPTDFTTLTGGVDLVHNSTAVNGVGTLFLAQLAPGDLVQFNGVAPSYQVAAVNSNTSLTLTTEFAGATNPVTTGYALLSDTSISNTGASVINGDVDLSPAGSITPGGWTVTGTVHNGDATAAAALAAANASFTAKQSAALASEPGSNIPSVLDGQTLNSPAVGVTQYFTFASGAATLNGVLTLNGPGNFVIYTASTLGVGASGAATVTLTGGALASNVYWVVGSSATLQNAGTIFNGNVLAQAAISFPAGGLYNGSFAALGAALTTGGAITVNGNSATPIPVPISLGDGIVEQMNAGFSPVITFNSTVSTLAHTVTLPSLPVTGDTLLIPGFTYTVSPTPASGQYTISGVNPLLVVFNATAANQFVQITYAVAPTLVASIFAPPFPSTANYVVVSTVSTVNAEIQIGNGTANTTLGFTPGTLIEGPQEPAAGVTYTFTYGTPKMTTATFDDYGPTLYTDLISLIAAYGPVATSNDFTSPLPGSSSLPPWAPWSVTNTLPLGAQIVFTNSGNTGGIMAVQCNPADGAPLAQFQNALNKLANVSGVNIVVCLTPDPLLTPSIVSHVVNASQPLEGNFRTAMIGFDPAQVSLTNSGVDTAISIAEGVAASGSGRRFLMPWPPAVNLFLAGSSTIPAQLDGSFLAAAIAGLRIDGNNDVATPLLRQFLFPFTTAAVNLMRTTKLQLRDGGVTVVELQNGNIVITEDTTTDRSTVDNEEFSVTEIVDFTATTVKTLLNSIFIGVKILSNTTSIITATIQVLLNNLIALNIITNYQNVTAQVSPLDPRQIDVSFEIAPVYGLRYISVQFSLQQ